MAMQSLQCRLQSTKMSSFCARSQSEHIRYWKHSIYYINHGRCSELTHTMVTKFINLAITQCKMQPTTLLVDRWRIGLVEIGFGECVRPAANLFVSINFGIWLHPTYALTCISTVRLFSVLVIGPIQFGRCVSPILWKMPNVYNDDLSFLLWVYVANPTTLDWLSFPSAFQRIFISFRIVSYTAVASLGSARGAGRTGWHHLG